MSGPAYAELVAVAAAHSMTVRKAGNRVVATRVGPGWPRRLVTRVPDAATAEDWETASAELSVAIKAEATPDAF